MQLLGKLDIKSKDKIIGLLNQQETGRICSIDKDGYPQIIPMNFVYKNDAIYMHSHIKGEKLENIAKIQKWALRWTKAWSFFRLILHIQLMLHRLTLFTSVL